MVPPDNSLSGGTSPVGSARLFVIWRNQHSSGFLRIIRYPAEPVQWVPLDYLFYGGTTDKGGKGGGEVGVREGGGVRDGRGVGVGEGEDVGEGEKRNKVKIKQSLGLCTV